MEGQGRSHDLEPTIDTQAALQDAWRHLMGPWSYGGHSIWMMLIADDRPLPQLTEITEDDRAWATSLYAAARAASVPCEVVHLATRGAIRPIPLDDVGLIAKPA